MRSPSDDAVRAAVHQVLSRPEFQPVHHPWLSALRRLLSGIDPRLPDWVGWLLLALGALAVAWLLRRLLSEAVPVARPPSAVTPSVLEVTEGRARSWNDALADAKACARSGDTRGALWIGHRLLLHKLDLRGSLRFAPDKTNGRYLRECAPDAPGRHLLERLTVGYDQVVYGHHQADAESLGRLLDEVEHL